MTAKPTALITGASSGIGAAFARQLAAQGYHLILVARRQERLEALAAELQQKHAIKAQALPADLSRRAEIDRVQSLIAAAENLTLLINNAGFGTNTLFAESDLEKQLAMIDTHITASTCFCRAALPGFIARRSGGIINVASIAAFLPSAKSAVYAASKSYLLAFTEALRAEVGASGVKVQALCPGFTYSEFHDTPEFTGQFNRTQVPRWLWMTADAVAAESLKALARNQTVCLPGWQNRWLIFTLQQKFIPRNLIRWLRKK